MGDLTGGASSLANIISGITTQQPAGSDINLTTTASGDPMFDPFMRLPGALAGGGIPASAIPYLTSTPIARGLPDPQWAQPFQGFDEWLAKYLGPGGTDNIGNLGKINKPDSGGSSGSGGPNVGRAPK